MHHTIQIYKKVKRNADLLLLCDGLCAQFGEMVHKRVHYHYYFHGTIQNVRNFFFFVFFFLDKPLFQSNGLTGK